MAAEGNSLRAVQRSLQGFIAILTSTACEWVLIVLLLIDAVLSYLLTKFADYCKLQIPCILCSRLDHVIGNEKPGFYRDLLCSNHVLEISSLISCHIHGKLADGHGMCNDCMFSFTTKNISFSEMQRILGAKLGMDIGGSGLQSLLLNRDFLLGSADTRPCSCCGKPWRPRENAQRFFQLKSPGSLMPKPTIPLPHSPIHGCIHRRNNFKKMRNKFYGSVTSHCLGKCSFDPLYDVGYTELKLNSDSESEIPFSDDDDDDDSRSTICENSESKDNLAVQCAPDNPSQASSNDLISSKVTKCLYNSRPLLSDVCVQPEVNEAHRVKSYASATADFVDERNWQGDHQKPVLILPDEIPRSATVLGISHEETIENKLKFPLPHDLNPLVQSEDTTFDYTPSLVGASPVKYVTGTSDIGHASIDNHKEVLKSFRTSVTSVKTDQVVNDSASVKPKHIDSSELHESDGSYRERESSGLVAELPIIRDLDRLDEEPKLLSLSEDTSDQGFDFSSENTRPGENGYGDVKIASSSNEIHMLRKSASVESSLESLDVSIVSEIDGESIVDRLRRQVEYDKKCIKSLYKELGVERSASTVAANQAMAMITRLQEEKAALHMEALQYLRMMEEQAEYDVEALEKANDLLAEKEREMQDMEAELESYRLNFPGETIMEDMQEGTYELNGKSKKVESAIVPFQDNTSLPLMSMITKVSKDSKQPFAAEIPHLEFEDEKLYIARCLQILEMKLHKKSCSKVFSNIPNGGHSKNFADDRFKRKESSKNEDILLNTRTEECDSSTKDDLNKCNGSTAGQEDAAASDGDDCLLSKANDHCDSDLQKSSQGQREVSLVALENEISDLNDRLEALEADHDFLEHMLDSLENGNEGLQFIREVAHQLQELRKIGMSLRYESVP